MSVTFEGQRMAELENRLCNILKRNLRMETTPNGSESLTKVFIVDPKSDKEWSAIEIYKNVPEPNKVAYSVYLDGPNLKMSGIAAVLLPTSKSWKMRKDILNALRDILPAAKIDVSVEGVDDGDWE